MVIVLDSSLLLKTIDLIHLQDGFPHININHVDDENYASGITFGKFYSDCQMWQVFSYANKEEHTKIANDLRKNQFTFVEIPKNLNINFYIKGIWEGSIVDTFKELNRASFQMILEDYVSTKCGQNEWLVWGLTESGEPATLNTNNVAEIIKDYDEDTLYFTLRDVCDSTMLFVLKQLRANVKEELDAEKEYSYVNKLLNEVYESLGDYLNEEDKTLTLTGTSFKELYLRLLCVWVILFNPEYLNTLE